jgi:hypothetical protein
MSTVHKMNDVVYKVLRGTYNLVMMTKKKDSKESFITKIQNIRNKKRVSEGVINEVSEEQHIKDKI